MSRAEKVTVHPVKAMLKLSNNEDSLEKSAGAIESEFMSVKIDDRASRVVEHSV